MPEVISGCGCPDCQETERYESRLRQARPREAPSVSIVTDSANDRPRLRWEVNGLLADEPPLERLRDCRGYVLECQVCLQYAVQESPPRCRRHLDRVECRLCHSYHPDRVEDQCVECPVCAADMGYHPYPVCCQPVPSGMVHCAQCEGSHDPPECGVAASLDGQCGRCRTCDRVQRAASRRNRYRSADDLAESNGHIYNYSFVPQPLVFRGDGPFFYGMELELEVNDLRSNISDAASVATEELGNLGYLKEDGSIDYGFEIVSTPMSYPYFMDHYPWEMLDRLRERGCRTNRGTGIHVHVSKAGFTPSHAYKWLKFWYRNQDMIQVFARRQGSRWAEFSSEERARVKHYCKGDMRTGPRGQRDYYSPQRYSAVNVLPANTYEVRVFRSTLSPRVARATLGLVAATVDYTRQITPSEIIGKNAWQWEAFGKWARAHSSDYPDLTREISRATQRLTAG